MLLVKLKPKKHSYENISEAFGSAKARPVISIFKRKIVAMVSLMCGMLSGILFALTSANYFVFLKANSLKPAVNSLRQVILITFIFAIIVVVISVYFSWKLRYPRKDTVKFVAKKGAAVFTKKLKEDLNDV